MEVMHIDDDLSQCPDHYDLSQCPDHTMSVFLLHVVPHPPLQMEHGKVMAPSPHSLQSLLHWPSNQLVPQLQEMEEEVSNSSTPLSKVGLGNNTVGLGTSTVGLGTSTVGLDTSTVGLGTSTVGLGTSTVGLGTSTVGLGTGTVGLGTSTVGLGTSYLWHCWVCILKATEAFSSCTAWCVSSVDCCVYSLMEIC